MEKAKETKGKSSTQKKRGATSKNNSKTAHNAAKKDLEASELVKRIGRMYPNPLLPPTTQTAEELTTTAVLPTAEATADSPSSATTEVFPPSLAAMYREQLCRCLSHVARGGRVPNEEFLTALRHALFVTEQRVRSGNNNSSNGNDNAFAAGDGVEDVAAAATDRNSDGLNADDAKNSRCFYPFDKAVARSAAASLASLTLTLAAAAENACEGDGDGDGRDDNSSGEGDGERGEFDRTQKPQPTAAAAGVMATEVTLVSEEDSDEDYDANVDAAFEETDALLFNDFDRVVAAEQKKGIDALEADEAAARQGVRIEFEKDLLHFQEIFRWEREALLTEEREAGERRRRRRKVRCEQRKRHEQEKQQQQQRRFVSPAIITSNATAAFSPSLPATHLTTASAAMMPNNAVPLNNNIVVGNQKTSNTMNAPATTASTAMAMTPMTTAAMMAMYGFDETNDDEEEAFFFGAEGGREAAESAFDDRQIDINRMILKLHHRNSSLTTVASSQSQKSGGRGSAGVGVGGGGGGVYFDVTDNLNTSGAVTGGDGRVDNGAAMSIATMAAHNGNSNTNASVSPDRANNPSAIYQSQDNGTMTIVNSAPNSRKNSTTGFGGWGVVGSTNSILAGTATTVSNSGVAVGGGGLATREPSSESSKAPSSIFPQRQQQQTTNVPSATAAGTAATPTMTMMMSERRRRSSPFSELQYASSALSYYQQQQQGETRGGGGGGGGSGGGGCSSGGGLPPHQLSPIALSFQHQLQLQQLQQQQQGTNSNTSASSSPSRNDGGGGSGDEATANVGSNANDHNPNFNARQERRGTLVGLSGSSSSNPIVTTTGVNRRGSVVVGGTTATATSSGTPLHHHHSFFAGGMEGSGNAPPPAEDPFAVTRRGSCGGLSSATANSKRSGSSGTTEQNNNNTNNVLSLSNNTMGTSPTTAAQNGMMMPTTASPPSNVDDGNLAALPFAENNKFFEGDSAGGERVSDTAADDTVAIVSFTPRMGAGASAPATSAAAVKNSTDASSAFASGQSNPPASSRPVFAAVVGAGRDVFGDDVDAMFEDEGFDDDRQEEEAAAAALAFMAERDRREAEEEERKAGSEKQQQLLQKCDEEKECREDKALTKAKAKERKVQRQRQAAARVESLRESKLKMAGAIRKEYGTLDNVVHLPFPIDDDDKAAENKNHSRGRNTTAINSCNAIVIGPVRGHAYDFANLLMREVFTLKQSEEEKGKDTSQQPDNKQGKAFSSPSYAWPDEDRCIVILGSLVDGGQQSVEVLTIICWLLLALPRQVVVLKGAHELLFPISNDCTSQLAGRLDQELRLRFSKISPQYKSVRPVQPHGVDAVMAEETALRRQRREERLRAEREAHETAVRWREEEVKALAARKEAFLAERRERLLRQQQEEQLKKQSHQHQRRHHGDADDDGAFSSGFSSSDYGDDDGQNVAVAAAHSRSLPTTGNAALLHHPHSAAAISQQSNPAIHLSRRAVDAGGRDLHSTNTNTNTNTHTNNNNMVMIEVGPISAHHSREVSAGGESQQSFGYGSGVGVGNGNTTGGGGGGLPYPHHNTSTASNQQLPTLLHTAATTTNATAASTTMTHFHHHTRHDSSSPALSRRGTSPSHSVSFFAQSQQQLPQTPTYYGMVGMTGGGIDGLDDVSNSGLFIQQFGVGVHTNSGGTGSGAAGAGSVAGGGTTTTNSTSAKTEVSGSNADTNNANQPQTTDNNAITANNKKAGTTGAATTTVAGPAPPLAHEEEGGVVGTPPAPPLRGFPSVIDAPLHTTTHTDIAGTISAGHPSATPINMKEKEDHNTNNSDHRHHHRHHHKAERAPRLPLGEDSQSLGRSDDEEEEEEEAAQGSEGVRRGGGLGIGGHDEKSEEERAAYPLYRPPRAAVPFFPSGGDSEGGCSGGSAEPTGAAAAGGPAVAVGVGAASLASSQQAQRSLSSAPSSGSQQGIAQSRPSATAASASASAAAVGSPSHSFSATSSRQSSQRRSRLGTPPKTSDPSTAATAVMVNNAGGSEDAEASGGAIALKQQLAAVSARLIANPVTADDVILNMQIARQIKELEQQLSHQGSSGNFTSSSTATTPIAARHGDGGVSDSHAIIAASNTSVNNNNNNQTSSLLQLEAIEDDDSFHHNSPENANAALAMMTAVVVNGSGGGASAVGGGGGGNSGCTTPPSLSISSPLNGGTSLRQHIRNSFLFHAAGIPTSVGPSPFAHLPPAGPEDDPTSRNEEYYAVEKLVYELFDTFPLACVVNHRFFCTTGGIPATLTRIEDMNTRINRIIDGREDGIDFEKCCEFVFSDPMDDDDEARLGPNTLFASNLERGLSHVFSFNAACRFLSENNLTSIMRANSYTTHRFSKATNLSGRPWHYQYSPNDVGYRLYNKTLRNAHTRGFPTVFSIFSAPSFQSTNRNLAAFLEVPKETTAKKKKKNKNKKSKANAEENEDEVEVDEAEGLASPPAQPIEIKQFESDAKRPLQLPGTTANAFAWSVDLMTHYLHSIAVTLLADATYAPESMYADGVEEQFYALEPANDGSCKKDLRGSEQGAAKVQKEEAETEKKAAAAASAADHDDGGTDVPCVVRDAIAAAPSPFSLLSLSPRERAMLFVPSMAAASPRPRPHDAPLTAEGRLQRATEALLEQYKRKLIRLCVLATEEGIPVEQVRSAILPSGSRATSPMSTPQNVSLGFGQH